MLYDGHGSVRHLADSTGALIAGQSYNYDAYGNAHGFTPGNVATKLLYSGEWHDSTAQQYYLRARWYSPATGRFNRMDPFAGNNQDPQSLHKYLYAHCDPINGTDPSGLFFGFSIGGVVSAIATMFSISAIFVPRVLGLYRSSKQLLDLSDFAQLLRRLANQGIIDMVLAEQMRIEVSRTAINLIGVIGGQVLDIVKKAVSYYAYGLLFAGVTHVAMGGVKAGVRLAKSAKVSIEIGDDIVKHHLVFKSAVRTPRIRQSLWKLPRSSHVGSIGLHARIGRSSQFRHLQPARGRTMKSIINDMGRQQWLDELGECYKWLETRWPGEYKGIHKAYQKAVGKIGASGLI